jgi:hypothetical protein
MSHATPRCELCAGFRHFPKPGDRRALRVVLVDDDATTRAVAEEMVRVPRDG